MHAIKKIVLLAFWSVLSVSSFAQSLDDALPPPPSSATSDRLPHPLTVTIDKTGKFPLTFDRVPFQQLLMFFYDQCEKRGLVFDPSVEKLEQVLTLKTPKMTCAQTKVVLFDALERSGLGVEPRPTYDIVRAIALRDDRDTWKQLIYMPRKRDALELADLAMIAVRKGSFAHQRRNGQVQLASNAGSPTVPDTGSNGASFTGKPTDKLVFFGPEKECDAVLSLLTRLDVPNPQVEIRAGIYEFQKGKNEGSAINAALSLFNSKVSVATSGGAASGNALKISLPNIDAALSLLDQDSRFKYVARPSVLAKDGESVRFFAGESVRVVGSILLDRNGNPIQSKETLSAGVTLEATPQIRGDVVDLTLHQAVSNFIAQATGDPSILTRDLRSRLVMQYGNVYAIGGLQAQRNTSSNQRFLGLPIGNSDEISDTEILILISVLSDVDK